MVSASSTTNIEQPLKMDSICTPGGAIPLITNACSPMGGRYVGQFAHLDEDDTEPDRVVAEGDDGPGAGRLGDGEDAGVDPAQDGDEGSEYAPGR